MGWKDCETRSATKERWNERKFEGKTARKNERRKQTMHHGMNDLFSEWMNEWMNEWMSEWMNEWLNEWRKEGMKEWRNEGMKEWTKKNALANPHGKSVATNRQTCAECWQWWRLRAALLRAALALLVFYILLCEIERLRRRRALFRHFTTSKSPSNAFVFT